MVPPLIAPVHAVLTDKQVDGFNIDRDAVLRTSVSEDQMEEIRKLHAEWFPVSYNAEFYSALVDQSRVVCVVAELKTKTLLGMATIGIRRRELTYNSSEDLLRFLGLDSEVTSIAYILTLGVVDELRRKGLGRKILEKSIEEVSIRDPHCEVIMLHVIEYNTSAARLYRKLGFREFKIEPNFYFFGDQWYNGILFYKRIKRNRISWCDGLLNSTR